MNELILSYFFLAMALIFTTAGQLTYKFYFTSKSRFHFILTILSFVLVPFFSYKALLRLPLDYVYMATSLTIVMILIFSAIFLKEKINFFQMIGSVLIISGIIIYSV